MSYYNRVRPTALVIQDDSILLVQYEDENGVHYNLPGGGAEPGETVVEGVKRELETMAEAFECYLKESSLPRLPEHPDPDQSAVKWISINKLMKLFYFQTLKK